MDWRDTQRETTLFKIHLAPKFLPFLAPKPRYRPDRRTHDDKPSDLEASTQFYRGGWPLRSGGPASNNPGYALRPDLSGVKRVPGVLPDIGQ